jgi:hypothetical protein
MATGGTMTTPSFIRIGSDIQKLLGRDTYAVTDTETESLVYFIRQ